MKLEHRKKTFQYMVKFQITLLPYELKATQWSQNLLMVI